MCGKLNLGRFSENLRRISLSRQIEPTKLPEHSFRDTTHAGSYIVHVLHLHLLCWCIECRQHVEQSCPLPAICFVCWGFRDQTLRSGWTILRDNTQRNGASDHARQGCLDLLRELVGQCHV